MFGLFTSHSRPLQFTCISRKTMKMLPAKKRKLNNIEYMEVANVKCHQKKPSCIRIPLVKLIIIHEENTKEIISGKEFVYLIQNHADLDNLLSSIFSPIITVHLFKIVEEYECYHQDISYIRHNTVAHVF